jgi:FixJ family two-component response regulator
MSHLQMAIVEDELPVRRAFWRLFASSGFDADTCESGAVVPEAMHGDTADCVVLERSASAPLTPPTFTIFPCTK